MKQAFLAMLERLGYVLMHADTWQGLQRRLAEHEASEQRWTSGRQAASAASEGASSERLRQLAAQLAAAQEQLGQCTRDKNVATLQIARADSRVEAFKRENLRLTAELKRCREQVAQGDQSGRILALESENSALRRRLGDLDVYLEETRATRRPDYL